jgi:hypothetical protein
MSDDQRSSDWIISLEKTWALQLARFAEMLEAANFSPHP